MSIFRGSGTTMFRWFYGVFGALLVLALLSAPSAAQAQGIAVNPSVQAPGQPLFPPSQPVMSPQPSFGQVLFTAELYCYNGDAYACTILQQMMEALQLDNISCMQGNMQACAAVNQAVNDYSGAIAQAQQSVRAHEPYAPMPNTGSAPFSVCPSSFAQSTCMVLAQADQAVAEAQQFLDAMAAQGVTATSGGLIERCANGDMRACAQYQRNADAALAGMDALYGPDSGWTDGFRFGLD